MKRIGFVASEPQYAHHLVPIFSALPADIRGGFYTTYNSLDYMRAQGVAELERTAGGEDFWMAASASSFRKAYDTRRLPIIYTEHGVGIAGAYPRLTNVCLLLQPNEVTAAKYREVYPDTPVEVIGTPKMDALLKLPRESDGNTVCISFHWDGSGNMASAFMEYRRTLALVRDAGYHVIGHGHPRAWNKLAAFYESVKVEAVPDFQDVVRRADLYVNDSSSTIFEWAALDRPVVLLNRRLFNAAGEDVRAKYASVGVTCDSPSKLVDAVREAFEDSAAQRKARRAVTAELYPFLGSSVEVAVDALTRWCA